MIELLQDIRKVLKSRKVRNKTVRYFKKRYKEEVADTNNIYEVHRLAIKARTRIEREEYIYLKAKHEFEEKWKSKLFKKRGR